VATHIALAAHLRGLKTVVADTDPQGSASDVLRARVGDGPTSVGAIGASLFAAQHAAVGSGMDVMVIDTAAGAVEDVAQAIVVADFSLLVVRPTLMDIAAAVRTVDVIRRLKKPAMVVVNQAPTARDGVEPPAVKRGLRALAFLRLPVVPTLLRSRIIYQSALETGRSVEECYDVYATREIAALWAFIEHFGFGKGAAQPENEDDDLKFAP
jgi:chromosome partitioning protein